MKKTGVVLSTPKHCNFKRANHHSPKTTYLHVQWGVIFTIHFSNFTSFVMFVYLDVLANSILCQ